MAIAIASATVGPNDIRSADLGHSESSRPPPVRCMASRVIAFHKQMLPHFRSQMSMRSRLFALGAVGILDAAAMLPGMPAKRRRLRPALRLTLLPFGNFGIV